MASPRKAVVEAPYQAPTLAEAHPGYASTEERIRKVAADGAKALTDLKRLQTDMQANPPARRMRDGVAELVGDAVEVDARPARAAELKATVANAEAAGEILRRRLDELRGPATAAVIASVRPEYGARVARLVKALGAVSAAYADMDGLINQLEAGDVAWSRLGVYRIPNLLERIATIEREAREAGYVG